jgi:Lrp/AsnC family leucine-responsive transcriptional regulator
VFERLRRPCGALPGVRETRTYAAMEEVKRDAPLPI